MKKLQFKTSREANKATLSEVVIKTSNIQKETDKAIQLNVVRALPSKRNYMTDEWEVSLFEDVIWIPKSQIEEKEEIIKVGTGEFRKRKGMMVEKTKRQATGKTYKRAAKWFLDKNNLNDIVEVL